MDEDERPELYSEPIPQSEIDKKISYLQKQLVEIETKTKKYSKGATILRKSLSHQCLHELPPSLPLPANLLNAEIGTIL